METASSGDQGVLAETRERRVLLFAPVRERLERLVAGLRALPGTSVDRGKETFLVTGSGRRYRFVVKTDPCLALNELEKSYFNVVALDLRGGPGSRAKQQEEFQRDICILDALDDKKDVELRYSFHRVICLVSGGDSRGTDATIRKLGARGVGGVLRDHEVLGPRRETPAPPTDAPPFAQELLDEIDRMTVPRQRGQLALCAAGGGTTGIYFEMGALKCLSDCLPPGTLSSMDMYFGISAGAVVSGMLANGFSIEEFMSGIAGLPSGRIPPFSLSLLDMPHVNISGLAFPFRALMRRLGATLSEILRGDIRPSWEMLFLEYSDLLTSPFHGEGFEAMLRELYTGKRGVSNDFRRLARKLYIGATDQDNRSHVLFGDSPFDSTPVSQAIVASISINPFFCSTEIGGRFYCDGAVTRTSGFTEAIRKGATLIFALDPFVPYVSQRPGFASEKGALYNVDQDIRTVSYTRFEMARYWILRKHPEVSLYTFLPANRLRKVMSVNPMDHRPYMAIWKGAYLSTLQRLQVVKHRLAGDLAVQGLTLDTKRAEEVAARLHAATRPELGDFFPDGIVRIERPPKRLPRVTEAVPARIDAA